MKKLLVLSVDLLAGCATAALSAMPPASDWLIGPVIRGENYSVGMPLQPEPTRDGWAFDFPYPTRSAGHVHYVTFKPGELVGAERIVVRYRVTAQQDAQFVPQEHPHLPGTVSLFFQRRGDNWSAKNRYNFYRWYAPSHSVQVIASGVHEMIVELDDPDWTPVMGGSAATSRRAFKAALADPSTLGLVFGSRAARGHGVFATAPARFELLSLEVQ